MKILDSEICNHSLDEDILKLWPFELSPFQKNAIAGILNNKHVLVSAHTGSGKTLPAEFTIKHFVSMGKRVIYTSPLKALTNQKFHDLTLLFPDISFGLLTGDNKFNPEAQVLLMTQEILRNTLFQQQLYDGDYVRYYANGQWHQQQYLRLYRSQKFGRLVPHRYQLFLAE